MADGDYTIPTYPASLSVNGGGHCGSRERHGLEGKDATLIHALHDERGHAENSRETRSEGRHILRAIFEGRLERERDFREVAVELQKVRCDMEEKVHCEGEKTRDLIKELRFRDKDAEIAELKAKLLLLTPPPVPVPFK